MYILTTAELLQKEDDNYLDGMKKYFNELKKKQEESPQKASNDAKKALIRTGVANSKGKIKKKIVS